MAYSQTVEASTVDTKKLRMSIIQEALEGTGFDIGLYEEESTGGNFRAVYKIMQESGDHYLEVCSAPTTDLLLNLFRQEVGNLFYREHIVPVLQLQNVNNPR